MSHYSDVIMSPIASRITGVTIVHSTVCSGADQRKYLRSASLTFVRGIHQSRMHSRHKGPVTRKMFPFHYVSMQKCDHIYVHIYIYIYILDSNLVITDPSDVQALLGARLSAGSLLTEIWICFVSSFGGFRWFRDRFTDQWHPKWTSKSREISRRFEV